MSVKNRAVVPISCLRLEERMWYQTRVQVCALHMRHAHISEAVCVRAAHMYASPAVCAPRSAL